MKLLVALGVLSATVASAAPLRLPDALVILEAQDAPVPGLVPEAAPPRFVLREDGTVFVGGTRGLATMKLDGEARRALEQQIADVRRLPLAGAMSFGSGPQRFRLFLKKGRPIDMELTGDPAQAPPVIQPLARLVRELSQWGAEGLRPYTPAGYWMSAREGTLDGGCRRWRGADPVSSAVFAPRVVTALEIKEREWPTGAVAASICEHDKRYIVTFRPMLPGEAP